MKTLTILVLPVILLAAGSVRANDPAAAEALFREGRSLLASGNYAEACGKLEESERLDPGIGTLYHLADCHEHVGKIATAWAELLDVAAQAKAHGQKEREHAAHKRAETLAPRLPHIVLEGTPPRGAEVKRDSTVVGAAELGVTIPVDPGPHKITVSSPGHVPWETTAAMVEGATLHMKLPSSLVAASTRAAPPVLTSAVVTPSQAAAPPGPAPSTEPTLRVLREPSHVQRNAALVIAGAGVVTVGVGAFFGVQSMDERNQSRAHCNGNVCDATGVGLRSDAISSGNASTVTFLLGAAAIVGGGVLYFTAPSTQELRIVSASPYVGPTGGGVSLAGAFR